VSGFLGTLKIAESWMSTSGVFERRSRTISLSHGGCSRAEVRGIPLLTLSILDVRKRKFLQNPKIFVVQDDLLVLAYSWSGILFLSYEEKGLGRH
jgi:hypothetical protein